MIVFVNILAYLSFFSSITLCILFVDKLIIGSLSNVKAYHLFNYMMLFTTLFVLSVYIVGEGACGK